MLNILKYFLFFLNALLFSCLIQAGKANAQVKDTILDLSDSLQTAAIDYSGGTISKINKNDAGNDYKDEVNFSGATFKVNADFQYATYKKKVSFSSVNFLDGADFSLAEFKDETTFSSASYYALSNYDNTVFNKDVSFLSSRFLRNVYFRKTHFHGSVSFLQAEFHDTANFSGTTFPKDVDFSHLILRGKLSFLQSTFCNYANFSQITFSDSGYLLFQKTVLPDTLDFSGNSKINNEIDLSAANLAEISHDDSLKGKSYKKHYIFLYKTDISKFHFDYTHFKLLFTDPSSGLEIPVDEKEAMYEQALKNFQDRGQQVSYKLLDIEYQDFIWQRSGFKWVGWVPRLWWNYGYDKEYVFYWTGFFLVFFSIIVFFMLEFLNENVYEVENIPKHKINKFSVRDFGFRIWYSFVYTVSIMFRLTLDVTKIKYHKIGGTILILIMYLLGLVCIAYTANFVLQR